MPCYYPLQATFSIVQGKKKIQFSGGATAQAKLFRQGVTSISSDHSIQLPCGRCMGCRLERSRQWAVRIMHEAKLYDDNCFLTLTFSPEGLKEQAPDGSLSKEHVQKFLKRLRRHFEERKLRMFYCGEYGERLERPHYHLCVFNLDFKDKKLAFVKRGFSYFTSDTLCKLWPFGKAVISDLTFDSASYVARYCTKKITGDLAEEHYGGRLPEFSQASLKPGIAKAWIEKFGESDVFSFDEVIVNGARCKPPRYYDKYLESLSVERMQELKDKRMALAKKREWNSSHQRLMVREKCMKARMKSLIRRLEKNKGELI